MKLVGIAIILALAEAAGGAEKAPPAQAAELAAFIKTKLKFPRGLGLDIGCGDGALALALAQQTDFRIDALEPDAALAAKARQAVREARLEDRVRVVEEPFAPLEYPSQTASLVICGDGFGKGLRGRSLKEIFRVLSPNGVALLGQAEPAPEGAEPLTRAKLEGWLRAEGLERFEIVETHGVWACVTKPTAAEWDEWPQRGHDAANSWSSRDTLKGAAFTPRWWTDCRPATSSAAVLLASGRLVLVGLAYKNAPEQTPFIQVLDAFSGVELWSKTGVKELPLDRAPGVYSNRENCCDSLVLGSKLYVLAGAECHVFALDTGKSLAVWKLPAEAKPGATDVWLHLAADGGTLFAASGASPNDKVDWNTMMYRGEAGAVFALDPDSGKVRWAKPEPFSTASLAISERTVFFVDKQGALTGLDAASGAVRWSSPADLPEGAVLARLAVYSGKVWMLYNRPNKKATSIPALLTIGQNTRELAAYSATDGKRLFAPDLGGGIAGFTFSGGTLLGASQHADGTAAADAATGKLLWRIGGNLKCTPSLATPNYLVQRGGGLSPTIMDLSTAVGDKPKPQIFAFSGFRPSCSFPAMPGYGMFFVQAEGCRCVSPMRGLAALATGPAAPNTPEARLIKGPAFDRALNKEETAVSSWAGWRADAARSGHTSEQPVLPLKESWRSEGCTAPLALGGGALFGVFRGHDLQALDPASGKLRWTVGVAGRVEVAPYFAQGRVYVSDNDGWARALAAADGTEAWRFHAALGKERIVAYERYQSRWPSRCGVVVRDGTAYFAAGLFPSEKAAVYAIDAATGESRWSQTYAGAAGFKNGFVFAGPLALGSKQLFVPSGDGWATRVALEDPAHPAAMLPGVRGGAVAAIGDVPVGAAEELRVAWHVMWFAQPSETLPVVEGETVYRAPTAGGVLAERWIPPVAKGVGRLGETGKPAANDPDADPAASKEAKPAPKPETLWKTGPGERVTALIHAGHLVFAGSKDKVIALQTSDGKELWSADLPGAAADLAFKDGRLFVVTASGQLLCFAP
ncbi:MAG: PQQ-binding-like beta-propeller repeat protein [Planctomycetes bacterium]|nr:PQQ-binding-like beta-propeller repeat protein [Planctomycetota bacterium]